jgi:hypothetical protein
VAKQWQYAVRYAELEQRCSGGVFVASDPALLGSCKEPLKAQAVGNMLYGMQGMSSVSPGAFSAFSFLDCWAAARSR